MISFNEENEGNFSKSLSEIRLELDQFRSINHILLTGLGIPLNLLIVIVILTNQRLKKKPRNLVFLGASVSAVFTLLTILVELLAYHFQSVFFCKIFGLSTGLAYSCLLYNLVLALIDRYLAIVCPLSHRKVVTVKNVLITQTIGAVVIFFLFKWPYVFSVVPLQCDFVLIEGKTTAVTNAVLISLIVILNIVVYVKTKHYARPDRTVPVSVSFVNNQRRISPDDEEDELQQVVIHIPTSTSDNGTNKSNNDLQQRRSEPSPSLSPLATRSHINSLQQNIMSLQIHGGNRRMEMEATFTLLIGVSSLLIFTAPMLIISFIEMGCLSIVGVSADNNGDEHQHHCSRIFRVSLPYCREFLLYHLVYNPIMYAIRSKEFSSTLTEKWARTHQRRQCCSEIRNLRINTATTPRLPARQSFQLANVT